MARAQETQSFIPLIGIGLTVFRAMELDKEVFGRTIATHCYFIVRHHPIYTHTHTHKTQIDINRTERTQGLVKKQCRGAVAELENYSCFFLFGLV
jgi:hypothetical protein